MHPLFQQLLLVWIIIFSVINLTFGLSEKLRNAGIIDVLWGFSFGVLAIYFAFSGNGDETRRIILALATCISTTSRSMVCSKARHLAHGRMRGDPETPETGGPEAPVSTYPVSPPSWDWGPDFESFAKGNTISTAQNRVPTELQISQILSGCCCLCVHFFYRPLFGTLSAYMNAIS